MHVLIIEDEIPAFEKLRTHLVNYLKDSFTYDWARSNSETLHFINANTKYDIIVSDIQLLDGECFEIFETLELKTPIIFCSAYNEYLFKAFQTNGIAYILKPYDAEDIERAFAKYNNLFEPNHQQIISKQLFKHLKSALHDSSNRYKKQLVIKNKKGIQLLEIQTISLIEARGDFCKIVDSNSNSYLYSQNIGSIYASLNPHDFFRINRSQIVHIKHINTIENYFKNRLLIGVKGHKEKAKTSSKTTSEFRVWLDR